MFRAIDTALWSDPKVKGLPPEGKLLFVYLITNRHTHVSGIYYLPKVLMLHETGIKDRVLDTLLDTLAKGNLVQTDAETEVVWVVNMLRYQGSGGKIRQSVGNHLKTLHGCRLIPAFLNHYKDLDIGYTQEPDTPPIPYGDPIQTNPLARARYQEQEQEQEQEEKKKTAAEESAAFWPSPEALVALYNTHTPDDHPKVALVSPQRKKKATEILRLFPEQAFWLKVCEEITLSRFLRGQQASPDRRPIKRGFDWLLQKGEDGIENCVKTYEGKYRDAQPHHYSLGHTNGHANGNPFGMTDREYRTVMAGVAAAKEVADDDDRGPLSFLSSPGHHGCALQR
jgi:hypothetical protein